MALFNRKKVAALTAKNLKLEEKLALILDINANYGKISSIVDHKLGCEVIVFSKDRAMQLHNLLSSYFHYVKNPAPVHVLYTHTAAHENSYSELKEIFKDRDVRFIKETHFKTQLLETLAEVKAEKLFFMTDDDIFLDEIDLNDFTKYNPQYAVPTLTKGRDLTYCYPLDKEQELPTFLDHKEVGKGQLIWTWASALASPDWAYPLSLNGSLYNTYEITELIKRTDFKAPNSLESNLQEFLPLFLNRYAICYEKVNYVCVPYNLVQEEWHNKNTNNMDIEFLLEKWNEGKRIYFEELRGVDVKVMQKAVYSFVDR